MDDARYFAYQALLSKKSIEQTLADIQQKFKISTKDFNLAYEIASGVTRRLLSLDYLISLLQEKIKLKKEGKTLLRIALYQYFFMDRIPYYSICHQTIEIAKHQKLRNIPFINVLLRKIEKENLSLPEDKSISSLAIRYSYPEFFVEELLKDVEIKKTEEILSLQNQIFPPFARVRDRQDINHFIELDSKKLNEIKNDPGFYIQNPTFCHLVEKLQKQTKRPEKILDLCAAPGGKLLLVHDLYPKAKLFANDFSKHRLLKLKENLKKYQIQAELFSENGETFTSNELFDLIILDVPCSNSGVLGKRVEARWRLSKDNLNELAKTQKKILKNAAKLLSENGVIWYITCSILSSENENVIEKCLGKELKLKGKMHTLYPTKEGLDGGFGCVLEKA